ncbi:hypothetical protein [Terrisporobacter mayombei]|uniref:Uncharacterized protein n=1 Tax=Terrisporobacter mayombei TaxID=1541 RepID=A0ABY9Q0J5_9FIRM|nr:hypothetical protein [Terrisporobacter mayombei]MCC3868649.1 hypothetical protein [Terrisporobacter mayombei]WMT80805.1 hypothetical protein TEMA_11270 [Terrisporobacter mayombei]
MHYTITVEELYKNGYKDIPTRGGVYIVKVPENFTVEITNNTTGIKEHKGKNLLYNKEYLEEKYNKVVDKDILYYGKATSLRNRITSLVKYAYGKCKNHRGGKALWQIKNSTKLIIEYYIFDDLNDEVKNNNKPRDEEKRLIMEYKNKNNNERPFANFKD